MRELGLELGDRTARTLSMGLIHKSRFKRLARFPNLAAVPIRVRKGQSPSTVRSGGLHDAGGAMVGVPFLRVYNG
jgi:hypothetical protein